jgi:hypothetical protein
MRVAANSSTKKVLPRMRDLQSIEPVAIEKEGGQRITCLPFYLDTVVAGAVRRCSRAHISPPQYKHQPRLRSRMKFSGETALLNNSRWHGTAHPPGAEWGAPRGNGEFQFRVFASCKSA